MTGAEWQVVRIRTVFIVWVEDDLADTWPIAIGQFNTLAEAQKLAATVAATMTARMGLFISKAEMDVSVQEMK